MNPIIPVAAITKETLEMAKGLFANQPFNPESGLRKAGISTAENLVGINLEAPAKNLYPVYSPLRNRIPRKREAIGSTAVMWKAIKKINSADVSMGVPEGTRNSKISIVTEEKTASYKSLGLDNEVTVEAIQMAKEFQDVRATAAMNLLYACMIGEEQIILGGNKTDLGAPAGLAGAGSTTSTAGALSASTDYDIKVSCLTLRGWRLNAAGSTLSKSGAAVLAEGESDPSAKVDVNTGVGNDCIDATCTAKKGAVAYNWYIATNGGIMQYAGMTTVNAFTYTEVPAAAQPNATDETGDALVYDGIIPSIETGCDADLFKSMDNAVLTAGNGGIVQFDAILQTMWDKYRLGPTKILVNSQQAKDITGIVAGTSNPAYRIILNDGQKNIVGGMYVASYLNKFASAFAEGIPNEVPIFTHPDMPPGTIIFLVEQLPFPNNQVPAVWELSVLQEYTQYEYAFAQRKYEFGIYHIAVLKDYYALAQAAIVNVKPS